VEEFDIADLRNLRHVRVGLGPGLNVFAGRNAQGKTSLLEALGWAATARSFRGVPDAALVRSVTDVAYLRVTVEEPEREQLLEAEIRATGRNRVQLNRHALARTRDLLGLLRVTVFAPDDLQLVKGGPAERRSYLDDLLVAVAPRYDAVRNDYERVLKQRNALLRQGARGPDGESTLVVFDQQLVRSGSELVRGRLEVIGPTTAADVADALGIPQSDIDFALGALEHEGFALRGRFSADFITNIADIVLGRDRRPAWYSGSTMRGSSAGVIGDEA